MLVDNCGARRLVDACRHLWSQKAYHTKGIIRYFTFALYSS